MNITARQKLLDQKADAVHENIRDGFLADKKLAVIKAPPGSGKTFMLLRILASLVEANWRIAIATQTNTQAEDLIRQLSEHEVLQNFSIARLGSSGSVAPDGFPTNAEWVLNTADISEGPGVAVSTAAKWASLRENPGFDLFAIDEAWQMKWADMMRCSAVSDRYLLIGDPGQIPPVTSVDTARWGTSHRPPHKAVPEVALEEFLEEAMTDELPAVRRLPNASVDYVKPFYDFDFEAYAEPEDRAISFGLLPESPFSKIILGFSAFEPQLLTVPTPEDGPPIETDADVAEAIKSLVEQMLSSNIEISLAPGQQPRPITQNDIGISATHRAMLGMIRKTLGTGLAHIRVDTPERWQGLQMPFMIAVHPLSSALNPSDFDLQTGRLCVMASRHQIGLVIVSRDHIFETLADTVTFATQAPGQPDETGRGREAHDALLGLLEERNRVVAIS